jgi:ribosome modulation factor
MFKAGIKVVLIVALAAAPIAFVPRQAQAQTEAERNAYQAGYNNGVNDRNQNKPLNLTTGNWHGQNLQAYQRGYQDGYRSAGRGTGYHAEPNRGYEYDHNDNMGNAQNDAERRAYQAGYNNGVNDRNQNKPLNLRTDNWHGENLPFYQRGYQEGYRSANHGNGWENHGPGNQYYGPEHGDNLGSAQTDPERRAYEAGYNNGVNDRSQNKPLNLKTDNWHGENLNFYRQGYEDGYHGRGQHHHH